MGVILLASSVAQATDCAFCGDFAAKLNQQQNLRVRTADILEKNKAYLAKLGPDDTSKRIKVNSNILIASVQIETIDNNIQTLKKAIQEKGCGTCIPQAN